MATRIIKCPIFAIWTPASVNAVSHSDETEKKQNKIIDYALVLHSVCRISKNVRLFGAHMVYYRIISIDTDRNKFEDCKHNYKYKFEIRNKQTASIRTAKEFDLIDWQPKTTTKQRLTYAEGRSLTFSWRIASNFWHYYPVFPRRAATRKNAKTFYKCWWLLVQSLVFAGPLVAEKSDTDNQTPRGKFMTMNRPCWFCSCILHKNSEVRKRSLGFCVRHLTLT